MKLSKSLSILLLAGGVSYASSLAVYQDKTIYTFTAQDNYIGFTQGVRAKCKGNTISLSTMTACPEDDRLCKLLTKLKTSEQKLRAIQSNMKVLDQLISLPKPTSFDANNWIDTARLVGEEQASLSNKKDKLNQEVVIKQRDFQKQAPVKQSLQTTKKCNEEIELNIPYGYVSFSSNYEADLVDEKEIIVTQNISITNRSGIDIKVDTAMFYYRSANQYVHPIHFNPWIVNKYTPKKRLYKKTRAKVARADMVMMAEENMMGAGGDIAPVEPIASYEDAREYKIKDLILPSTGVPLDVKVLTWKAPLECEVRAYPYVNTRAFHVCSFKPKHQIDSNRWKIKSGEVMINENAVGEYRDEKYNLYTKVEEDIQIQRKSIVQKERETGIFGGTARKKDGFKLILTNKSDKARTLTLIDRIPTSSTEEIKVKLLSIKSNKKIDYKMLKDGEIEMKINLAANESKKIEVLFEISYDKELKINY